MKIDVTINKKTFSEIEEGEAFYYEPSGVMWIKLNCQLFDTHGNPYNAVALDDGTPSYFEPNDIMTTIPTKLVNV